MAAIVLAAAASSAATSLGAGTFFAAVAGGAGGFLGGFVDRSLFSKESITKFFRPLQIFIHHLNNLRKRN